jgi:glucose/mannose-6-phosphate isomerase
VTDPSRLDSRGVWEAAAALPDQLTDALASAQAALDGVSLPNPSSIHAVAVCGVGPDALAGDFVRAITGANAPVPLLVVRGHDVPAFVGPHTLVLAVSSSGGDIDVLAATRGALAREAPVVVVSGDGMLRALALEEGLPLCPVMVDESVPRAALGATVVPLLTALFRAGLISDPGPPVTGASAALRRRSDAFADAAGPAAEVARRIGRTMPVVYGAAGIGAVAAHRWKSQVNLNAKSPAFHGALPASTRDELAGWGQGGDVTRQVMSLVLLRHGGEDPMAAGLFEAVATATDEVMADTIEVWGEGDDDFLRFFDLALLGDFVSLFLAAREGVDPGPAPTIEDLGAGPA